MEITTQRAQFGATILLHHNVLSIAPTAVFGTCGCARRAEARVFGGFQGYLRSSLSGIKGAAASFAPDSRSTARWRTVTA